MYSLSTVQKRLSKLRNVYEKLQPSTDFNKDYGENDFLDFMKNVSPIYEEEKKRLKEESLLLLNKDPRLYKPTTFEIMNKSHLEEVHSDVLQYLFWNEIFGKHLLIKFLSKIDSKESQSVINRFKVADDWNVQREYSVKGKRIDIYISGSGFEIIIENKYFAQLRESEPDTLQTEFYYNYISSLRPNSKKVFIILDYKGTQESQHYHTLSYDDLLDVSEELKPSIENDSIFDEYYYLLKRLSLNFTTKFEEFEYANPEELMNKSSLSFLTNIKQELSNGY